MRSFNSLSSLRWHTEDRASADGYAMIVCSCLPLQLSRTRNVGPDVYVDMLEICEANSTRGDSLKKPKDFGLR
jgi:hypothetical protein